MATATWITTVDKNQFEGFGAPTSAIGGLVERDFDNFARQVVEYCDSSTKVIWLT